MDAFSGGLVAFFATSFFVYFLRSRAARIGLVDRPTYRKVHREAIPTVGGIAIVGGFLLALSPYPFTELHLVGFVLPSLLLVGMGTVDDLVSLSYKPRLIVQVLAGLLMTLLGGVVLQDLGALVIPGKSISLGVLSIPFTIICLVGMVNAFNMSDGLDGLAGAFALVALLGLGLVAYLGGQSAAWHLILLLGFCVLAFLAFNARSPWRKRAVVFLGDSGSTFLGFASVWLSVKLSQGEHAVMTPVTALWFVALPFFDLATATIRRLVKRRSPFEADIEHLHHLFLWAGFSVGQTVMVLSVVALLLASVGVSGLYLGVPENIMFLLYLGAFGLYFYLMMRAWRLLRFCRRHVCRRQAQGDRRSGQDRRRQQGVADAKAYEGADRRKAYERRQIADRRSPFEPPAAIPRAVANALQPTAEDRAPKTVFVNRFFWPDHSATSQLLSDLAFAMAASGRRVRVVTSRQLYDQPTARLAATEDARGLRIERVWTSQFGRKLLPARAIDYLTFYGSAFWWLWRGLSKGDVVVAMTDPPLIAVPTAVVAAIKGAKLVNWHQDVFPEVAINLGVKGMRGALSRALVALRNAAVRNAAMNVVLSRRMAQSLTIEGAEVPNVKIIPNWSDGDAIYPRPATGNPLRSEWGLAGRFVVAYSGNMGRVHDFRAILEAAERLAQDPHIVFLFIGDGFYRDWIKGEAKRLGLHNIVFRPYQPRGRLLDSLGVADVHLVSLRRDMEGLVFPSKLYGILAAGRATIFVGAREGDVAQILQSEGCGLAVSGNDAQGVANAIRALEQDPARLRAMGERGRRLFERHYEMHTALKSWCHVLSPLLAEDGSCEDYGLEKAWQGTRKQA